MKPTVATDQIKRFRADGVVFLEGFFPQEYIDSLTKGIQKKFEDPDHSKKIKEFGMTSGDRVDRRVYPEFKDLNKKSNNSKIRC